MKPNPRLNNSLQEGISDILLEIQQAEQADRPSIILAIYASEIVRARVEKALTAALERVGQSYARIQFDPHQADVTRGLPENQSHRRTVFAISGIGQGGGSDNRNAYRALNLHREAWVENRIRAIFWLTAEEASNLPHHAPDFWAFRHRVFVFERTRGIKHESMPSGFFLWESQPPWTTSQELEVSIKYHNDLLSQLPPTMDSLSTQVDLQLNLIHLYWAKGDLTKAMVVNREGLASLELRGMLEHSASLLNCRGILENEIEGPNVALPSFEQASKIEVPNSIFRSNLAAANFAVGRRHEATLLFKQAIKTNPNNPLIWSVWGFVSINAGKYDDAKTAFETAHKISPGNDEYTCALAMCYFKMGNLPMLEEIISKQLDYNLPMNPIFSACVDFMRGNSTAAETSLLQATRSDISARLKVIRSPLVQALFDSAEFWPHLPSTNLNSSQTSDQKTL